MDLEIHHEAEPELDTIHNGPEIRSLARAFATIDKRRNDSFQSGVAGAPLTAVRPDGQTLTLKLHIVTEGRVTIVVVVDEKANRGMLVAAGVRPMLSVSAEARIVARGETRTLEWIKNHGRF